MRYERGDIFTVPLPDGTVVPLKRWGRRAETVSNDPPVVAFEDEKTHTVTLLRLDEKEEA